MRPVLVLLTLLGSVAVGLIGCAPGDPFEAQSGATEVWSEPASPSLASRAASAAEDGGLSPSSVVPAAYAPQHISYPAAGIEVAVLPLTPSADELTAGSLVPPKTMDAYWLTTFGQPGSDSRDTTYIVGHSWEDADAPFNRLSNRSAPGDEISVRTGRNTVTYKVQRVSTYDKDTLRTSDVWKAVPGRLVLISCYTKDIWGRNVVVTATALPDAPRQDHP
jgi:hypothetical protein